MASDPGCDSVGVDRQQPVPGRDPGQLQQLLARDVLGGADPDLAHGEPGRCDDMPHPLLPGPGHARQHDERRQQLQRHQGAAGRALQDARDPQRDRWR